MATAGRNEKVIATAKLDARAPLERHRRLALEQHDPLRTLLHEPVTRGRGLSRRDDSLDQYVRAFSERLEELLWSRAHAREEIPGWRPIRQR